MEKFQFDVISQTLTITAQFAKMMNDPESDEYKLVMRFRQDFPTLTISKKTHKSATHCTTKSGEKFNCNQFKNLTYDRMEKFISALPKSESYLREYSFVKDFALLLNEDYFIYGFRLGARMMLDVVGDYKGQFYSPGEAG